MLVVEKELDGRDSGSSSISLSSFRVGSTDLDNCPTVLKAVDIISKSTRLEYESFLKRKWIGNMIQK